MNKLQMLNSVFAVIGVMKPSLSETLLGFFNLNRPYLGILNMKFIKGFRKEISANQWRRWK